MQREDGKRADDVYENYNVKPGRSGKAITDRKTSRIQSSELTGSDSVKIRAAVVCLVLLCVLLLTAVIVLCVTFTQERQQLLTMIISHTEERQQLLTNITNLTEESQLLLSDITNLKEEKQQLLTNITNLIQLNVQFNQEKNELLKLLQDGWIYYQSSVYYVSNETKNWTESRRSCTERGADLVIIENKQTQDFLNNISSGSDVWIGLTDGDEEGRWKWVDGSTLPSDSGFWRPGEPNGGRNENCAMSRSTGWFDYTCSNTFKWICEKKNIK